MRDGSFSALIFHCYFTFSSDLSLMDPEQSNTPIQSGEDEIV